MRRLGIFLAGICATCILGLGAALCFLGAAFSGLTDSFGPDGPYIPPAQQHEGDMLLAFSQGFGALAVLALLITLHYTFRPLRSLPALQDWDEEQSIAS